MQSLKQIVCEELCFTMIHLAERNDLPCFRRNFDRLVNHSPKFIMVAENISDRFSVYRQKEHLTEQHRE